MLKLGQLNPSILPKPLDSIWKVHTFRECVFACNTINQLLWTLIWREDAASQVIAGMKGGTKQMGVKKTSLSMYPSQRSCWLKSCVSLYETEQTVPLNNFQGYTSGLLYGSHSKKRCLCDGIHSNVSTKGLFKLYTRYSIKTNPPFMRPPCPDWATSCRRTSPVQCCRWAPHPAVV